jgi:four helix bundle protein
MFNFEKLEVWRKSLEFADLVYRLTRTFPDEERFGLTNQMRRASVSVSSNIAEGSSRSSKTDYSRFVELAAGSLFEVISQSHIALRQAYLSEADFSLMHTSAEELSRMLSGLKSYLVKSPHE